MVRARPTARPVHRANAGLARQATSQSPSASTAATRRRLARSPIRNYTFFWLSLPHCSLVPRQPMKFGIWTPLPHTIRPEPRMDHAFAEIKARASLAGGKDGSFEFACDAVRRADELGFDTTLIAERFLGPDLSAWVPRDRMVNALGAGLVGTPQLLAERLRRYEEVGIDIMMTRFTPMMEGMETFGTEVMPLLGRGATE